MKKNCLFTLIILMITISISCEKKELDYNQIVEKELAKEVRHDSLFLGYKFGMESNKFFEYSWDLNQQQIITGQSVMEYKIDRLRSPVIMNYFPEFNDGKLHFIPAEAAFEAWAPWNKSLHSDSLIVDLIDMFEKDFNGNSFFKTSLPEKRRTAWVKIDGNRQISIYKFDDRVVRIEFLDLLRTNETL